MVVNAKNTRHTMRTTDATTGGNGSPFWNAAVVIATPSSPVFQVPVTTMERPVMVHITMVSIKVPVMDTRPWRTGDFVCAAAAAIGALPRPASLEKIPLAIPFCMATIMVPMAPPASALPEKALFTMDTTAAGIAPRCVTRIMNANPKYNTAIKGTTICETCAILFSPPIITRPTHTVRISPAMTVAME